MSEDYGNQSSQTELLNLLHSRQGHFRFESGHHGNLWLDLELLFLRPKAIQPFVDEKWNMMQVIEAIPPHFL